MILSPGSDDSEIGETRASVTLGQGRPALSGVRKAAMILMSLGDEAASEVLRLLKPEEVRRIANEVSRIRGVTNDELNPVCGEFEAIVSQGPLFSAGGSDFARRMLEAAFGTDTAEDLLPPAEPEKPYLDPEAPLTAADPRELARFLAAEHPQTVAVILSGLPPDHAVQVMKALPEDQQGRVGLRMASLGRVSREALAKMTQAIVARLRKMDQASHTDGARALAILLSRMDTSRAEAVLDQIQSTDKEAAANVRELFFVFDDIVRLDRAAIQALTSRVERRVLMTALKGARVRLRKTFLQYMSKNSATIFLEDMEALGAVRARERREAQLQVLTALRELQQAGVVSLATGGENELVV